MRGKHLLTTVVGSYPQPEWLIDRAALAGGAVPRIRASGLWRIPDQHLEEAQDDATLVAIPVACWGSVRPGPRLVGASNFPRAFRPQRLVDPAHARSLHSDDAEAGHRRLITMSNG